MFSQKQIEAMPEKIYKRYRDINSEFLYMLGERIKEAGEIIPADVHKLQKIYESGEDITYITNRLAEAGELTKKDIEEMFEAVAKETYDYSRPFYEAVNREFIPYEDNVALQRQVKALARQTVDEFENLAQSKAFLVYDKNGNIPTKFGDLKAVPTDLAKTYKITLDKAIQTAIAGYTDYNSQMRQVIKRLADSGIRDTVTYASGYTRRLDSSVRQNILWGIKNCNQEIADIVGEEVGCDGYEISYHSHPRPSHADMGGKQYAKGPARTVNGVYYPSFSDVENLLTEYGCLHFKFSIMLGLSTPSYSKKELDRLKREDAKLITFEGKEITKYDASQKQRKLETALRYTDDRITIAKASGDQDTLNKEKLRQTHLIDKYKELSKASGLPTHMEKIVSNFGVKRAS